MNQDTRSKIEKQQLSEEELQRTQVLNLEDFRSVARIEKIGSKKPAIIVAMIGVFSILLGTAFPAYQSYSARKEAEKNGEMVSARRDENAKEERQLLCIAESVTAELKIKERIETTYIFEEDELKSLKKVYYLSKINKDEEVPFFAVYKNAVPPFLIQINGYSTTIKETDDTIINTTKIDFDSVDLNAIPKNSIDNYRFNPEFFGKESEEVVKTTKESVGFKCE